MHGPDVEGQERWHQRPVRKVAAATRQGAQGQDPSAEEDQEPGVRRRFHVLRHPDQ